MKELLTYVAQNLVDHPDQVSVTQHESDGETVLELRVAPEDMGKVIGRQGRIAIASTGSPWLSHCDAGSEYEIAISHGEGRFVAPQNVLDQLVANGQVATQYVDLEGEPTMDQRYNPNGSLLAIEGITSPDGRVFGKMGHSERSGEYLYKNVTGDKYQPIFEGGVDYFKV